MPMMSSTGGSARSPNASVQRRVPSASIIRSVIEVRTRARRRTHRSRSAHPAADHRAVRVIVALVLSVLAIAGAVLYASESQRKVAEENYHEAIVARQLAADMLSRENALHEFLADGRPQTLVPIYELDRRQDAALERGAQELSSDSREELATLDAPERRGGPLGRRRQQGDRRARRRPRRPERRAVGRVATAHRQGLHRAPTATTSARSTRAASRSSRPPRSCPSSCIFALSVVFGAIALALRRCAAAATRRAHARARAPRARPPSAATPTARRASARRCRSPRTRARATSCSSATSRPGRPTRRITVLIRNNSGDRLEPAVAAARGLPARRAARARQAARLPRRPPQPPRRPGRRAATRSSPARSAARRRASRPASRCSSAARSSARC